ncbi:MAG: UV DNA damage endonuclease [Chlamydiae bacterium]|nr:UV DNA damage endonuclease [Chlamydiota bacterium]
MIRLGLCCLFLEAPIRFRTTTVKYTSSLASKGLDPLKHLNDIIESNLENLLLAIQFCANQGIGSFRINSGLLPIFTHPESGYEIDKLPNALVIRDGFEKARQEAHTHNIRLSFHPDQFVVLNSPREDVVEKSIADLEYQGMMAKLLGADVINIHGGGGYGDKPSALKRFAKNFQKLSQTVQSRLTLENDDKTYTPSDLIPLCKDLNIPLVYDVHHHRCLKDNLSILQATEQALSTWDREPYFHISSPKNGWGNPKYQSHHDFINIKDMPLEWKNIKEFTVDVEAKAKEIAVLKFKRDLITEGWHLN